MQRTDDIQFPGFYPRLLREAHSTSGFRQNASTFLFAINPDKPNQPKFVPFLH